MYKIVWDKDINGVLLQSLVTKDTLGVSPRPVFFEELDLLGLDKLGWKYPRCQEPLMWACNKQYFYRGEMLFEAKGANIYDAATVVPAEGVKPMSLKPVDMKKMLERNREAMFLLESEAIEFIRDTYETYTRASRAVEANVIDYEALAARQQKKTKQKMAVVKEDCDSFDIMPADEAELKGKKVLHTTKVDIFLASFSGGKDSQVVLDLCTRALPPSAFQVIYSDTGYELPSSLTLYEQVKEHYGKLYPDLKFSTARNHESVLNYWDKIGTPSDTHRWCCSIMKTAPLYNTFKQHNTNQQNRILTFDGVRSEESQKRSGYQRIGKGKHFGIYNAHPILDWNTTEIMLYLFKQGLHINQSYRDGKARVGCIICPFSTAWDDMIVQKTYPKELAPFVERIEKWAKSSGIKDTKDFLKDRRWKLKILGNKVKPHVELVQKGQTLSATISHPSTPLQTWIQTIGDVSMNGGVGELRFDGKVYSFKIIQDKKNVIGFTIDIANNTKLLYFIKRVINKSAYCVKCEVCTAECPTGALDILSDNIINKDLCIKCHKCLEFHEQGCIAADSIRMVNFVTKKMNAKLAAYKKFGLREEWVSEYFASPEDFWDANYLGTAMVDSAKRWFKDAGVIDDKNNITAFGHLLHDLYMDNPDLVWELLLIGLSYNSFIVNWFVNHVSLNQRFDRKTLLDELIEIPLEASNTTRDNALIAIMDMFDKSPLGETMGLAIPEDKIFIRKEYTDSSNAAIAYCIYRYADNLGVKTLRVSDFYSGECENGPLQILGITKGKFEKALREINSSTNRVLIAELSMGLDHITLRNDVSSENVIQLMLGL